MKSAISMSGPESERFRFHRLEDLYHYGLRRQTRGLVGNQQLPGKIDESLAFSQHLVGAQREERVGNHRGSGSYRVVSIEGVHRTRPEQQLIAERLQWLIQDRLAAHEELHAVTH
jgi:hypothetical protein